MTSTRPAPITVHRTQIRKRRVAALLVVLAAAVALGDWLLAASPSTTSAPDPAGSGQLPSPAGESAGPPRELPEASGEHGDAASRGTTPVGQSHAHGAVPDGTTVFDVDIPGVAKLAPDLLSAMRQAAADAADEGVRFVVDSGWRSPAYQRHLLDEAIAKYGSEQAASRWVASPDRSAHVSGDAVDIGPPAAAAWLARQGARYGLCQVYRNEPWHFELRPQASAEGCPPMYADPTQDPRLNP